MKNKAFPKRYAIYFADLNPTIGYEIKKVRPVVIISQDEMNQYLETIVICPITTSIHPEWRSRIQIESLEKNSEIAVDQIRTISKSRLRKKIGQLTPKEAQRLRFLITEMYGE